MGKVKFSVVAQDAGADAEAGYCGQLRERAAATSEVTFAALSWSFASIGLTLLNKSVVSQTHAPLVAVLIQMLVTMFIALCMRDLKFGDGWVRWTLTVPVLFAFMMGTSMFAMKYVTLGTFVVVRNMGPLVTLGVETALHRPDNLRCDWQTTSSLCAIVVGVFLYEVSDLKFSLVGIGFLLANLLFACTERLLQRYFLAVRAVDVSKPALMVLNNGVGALLIVLVLLIESNYKAPREEEFHRMRVALTRHPLNAGSALAASCLVGCAISYAGLWLQRLVTATSFMVLGCVHWIATRGPWSHMHMHMHMHTHTCTRVSASTGSPPAPPFMSLDASAPTAARCC